MFYFMLRYKNINGLMWKIEEKFAIDVYFYYYFIERYLKILISNIIWICIFHMYRTYISTNIAIFVKTNGIFNLYEISF